MSDDKTCQFPGCTRILKPKIIAIGGKYCYRHNIQVKMPANQSRRESVLVEEANKNKTAEDS